MISLSGDSINPGLPPLLFTFPVFFQLSSFHQRRVCTGPQKPRHIKEKKVFACDTRAVFPGTGKREEREMTISRAQPSHLLNESFRRLV